MNIYINWASTEEDLSSGFENNKGTDQPAHPHSLISIFIFPLFKIIIYRLATSIFHFFWLVSVAEQAGLNLTLSETPKTGFVAARPL